MSATTEVLEANVAALRESLNEFKTEVRTDIGNMNGEIKSLRDEIKSGRDDLSVEIKSVRDELGGEIKSLREKTDKGFERLFTRFDAGLKETNQALNELSKIVLKLDSGRAAIVWVGGGLIALITLAITVGKAFKWF